MTQQVKPPKGPRNWRAYFSAAVLVILGLASSNVALVASGVVEAQKVLVEQVEE